MISWRPGEGCFNDDRKNQKILRNFRTIQIIVEPLQLHDICRKFKVNMHGNVKLKITYPKFKEGEATVKEVKWSQITVWCFIQQCLKFNFS